MATVPSMRRNAALAVTEDEDAVEAAIFYLAGIAKDIRGVVMFWGFWVPIVSFLVGAVVLIGLVIAGAF